MSDSSHAYLYIEHLSVFNYATSNGSPYVFMFTFYCVIFIRYCVNCASSLFPHSIVLIQVRVWSRNRTMPQVMWTFLLSVTVTACVVFGAHAVCVKLTVVVRVTCLHMLVENLRFAQIFGAGSFVSRTYNLIGSCSFKHVLMSGFRRLASVKHLAACIPLLESDPVPFKCYPYAQFSVYVFVRYDRPLLRLPLWK